MIEAPPNKYFSFEDAESPLPLYGLGRNGNAGLVYVLERHFQMAELEFEPGFTVSVVRYDA